MKKIFIIVIITICISLSLHANENVDINQEFLNIPDEQLSRSSDITLSLPSDARGAPGLSVSIPLTLDNPIDIGIEGIDVTISFDENILDATGATLTGGVLENEDYGIQVNTTSDSLIDIWIYANSDLYTGSGNVAFIEFDVNYNASVGDTTSLVFIFAEVNETPVITSNGLFTVSVNMVLMLPFDASASNGDSVSIPLTLNNIDDIGVEGVAVTIGFNENILDATGATLSGTVLENQNYGLQVNTSTDDIIEIWIYAIGDLYSGSGIIAFLEFFVNPNAVNGETTELEFLDAEINEWPIYTVNGLFTVIGIYDISGITNYFSNNDPVPNTRINLTGDNLFTAYTDSNGYFLFSDIPYGNYISAASKEDDLGGLSSMDASRIARYGVGLYDFNCYEIITADVTLNGYVSPMDASRVARYGVGLIDSLNDDGLDWVFVADSIESCANWPPIVYESTKEYTPLNSDLFDEDFIGIRLGDVTGNWSPSYLLRLELTSKTISAFLPDTTVNQSVFLSIPLTVIDLIELEGMDIIITFNEDVIDATGASLSGGILEDQNFGYQINTTVDDEITLWIYAMENPFTGNGVVCYLEFDVVGNVNDSTSLIFTQFNVNEVSYLDNTTNGMVTISDQSIDYQDFIPDYIFLEQNYPNPFNETVTINYGLPKPIKVKIEIYNIKGQLVETLINENKPAGYHTVEWNAKDMSSGLYFYKLSNEDKIIIRKMVLMR
ncbi:MAG: T9SS type A sorting domain-containing protein [Candidatus Cloacimonetes bacterium]|nr:T9SS type A sorting domain-containing protein [Candidatus Cloacimonadota bacterium]